MTDEASPPPASEPEARPRVRVAAIDVPKIRVAEPPRVVVAPDLVARLRAAPVTLAFFAISVAVFLLAESHGRTTETETLLRFGADERVHVRMGEVWRLGSSMFLHIGWIHLLWNGYCSFGWCAPVERELGRWRFLVLYLASGVGGAVVSVLAHQVVAAGASGALFGVIGARIVSRRRALDSWSALTRDPATRSMVFGMALWTAIGVTAINMDNFAHGGGFVTGLAVSWALTAKQGMGRLLALAVAGIAALGVVAVRPGWVPSADEAQAMVQFAGMYAQKKAGPDFDRSARFARRACDAGNVDGCGFYGYLEYFGYGMPADKVDGMHRLRDACGRGSEVACSTLERKAPADAGAPPPD